MGGGGGEDLVKKRDGMGEIRNIWSYIEVGVQKFISRNSDGLALMTFGAPADDDFVWDGRPSSPSSLMCDDATDVVDDIVSCCRCMPNKLDKNQPR